MHKTKSLTTKLGSITLKNPIIAASGTFGYGCNDIQSLYRSSFGAITTKTVTLHPRAGNPTPRIFETPSGLLNSIGLENIGIKAFLNYCFPKNFYNKNLLKNNILKNNVNNQHEVESNSLNLNDLKDTRLFVSIGGDTIEEYVVLAEMLNDYSIIDAIELNISCPNVKKGCMAIGGNVNNIKTLLTDIKSVTNKPCIVKLSPNFFNIVEIAKCCKDYGADIISLVNCFLGMSIDLKTKQPRFKNIYAGLSGPAIKPLALKIIYDVCRNVEDIPVIGMGGIMNANDAREFMYAGATAISIGTANLVNPETINEIIANLS